jgi:hypothetical protein
MKLTPRLLILLALMTVFGGCQAIAVDGPCPPLASPPVAAVDALQGANDPAVDAWAVALERHYAKLKACGA